MSAQFLWVMADFILPIFLALLLVAMFGPVHRWFVDKFHDWVRLAALATTGTILLSVLIPLAGVPALAANGERAALLLHNLKGNRGQGGRRCAPVSLLLAAARLPPGGCAGRDDQVAFEAGADLGRIAFQQDLGALARR